VYKKIIKSPVLKIPEKIIVYNQRDINGTGKLKPYVKIINGTDFSPIWSNKNQMSLPMFKVPDIKIKGVENRMVLDLNA
jgi:hypothetical protein